MYFPFLELIKYDYDYDYDHDTCTCTHTCTHTHKHTLVKYLSKNIVSVGTDYITEGALQKIHNVITQTKNKHLN